MENTIRFSEKQKIRALRALRLEKKVENVWKITKSAPEIVEAPQCN